jgi:hypothetical protein
MEPFHWVMVALGVIGLLLNTGILAVTGTWKLAQLKDEFKTLLKTHREDMDVHLRSHRDDIDVAINAVRRECGEGLSAIRTKIHEVEVWARDTYVRRDSFYKVADQVQGDMKSMASDLKAQLEKIDGKLEKLRERVPPGE